MVELDSKQQIEEWFHAFGDNLYNYLVYFTGSNDVEDMVQETFIRAMRGLRDYRGHASPKTWLYAIARNVARDLARKRRTQPMSDDFFEDMPSMGKSTEEIVELDDTTRFILRVLQDVDPKYRDVILLRCMHDFSPAETAAILGWTKTKVSVTYHRGIKIVRTLLKLHNDKVVLSCDFGCQH